MDLEVFCVYWTERKSYFQVEVVSPNPLKMKKYVGLVKDHNGKYEFVLDWDFDALHKDGRLYVAKKNYKKSLDVCCVHVISPLIFGSFKPFGELFSISNGFPSSTH